MQAIALPAIAAAGSAIQGVAAIGAGNQAEAEGKARQAELEKSAQLAGISAAEQQASQLNDLHRRLGTAAALFGSRNVDPNSDSAIALEETARKYGLQDVQRTGFNALQQQSSMRTAGAAARQAGSARKTGAYLSAFGNFLQAGGEGYSAYEAYQGAQIPDNVTITGPVLRR